MIDASWLHALQFLPRSSLADSLLFYPHQTQPHKPMLVLSRKLGERIFIGDDIEIIVTRIEEDKVRIAISAPRDVPIVRSELIDGIGELREQFGLAKRPHPRS